MSVGKLFVLGAGASFSATRPDSVTLKEMDRSSYRPPPEQTPLDSNFIRALLDMKKQPDDPWITKAIRLLQENWFPIPCRSKGLEAAIQLQAANMEFTIGINQRKHKVSFEEYLDNLVHLIAHRVRMKRTIIKPDQEMSVYEQFVETFFDEETDNKIISFNYDDALDDFLLPRYSFDIRKVYFSALREKPGMAQPSPGKQDNPILLKLHGSVNWNCKSSDFRRLFSSKAGGQKGDASFKFDDIWFREEGTPKVGDNISPCIIPPIADKPVLRNGAFNNLWKIASRYLHECEELYFCGYSLPPTDAMASALFSNFRNDKLEKIVVIDRKSKNVREHLEGIIPKRQRPKAEWQEESDFGGFVDMQYKVKILTE